MGDAAREGACRWLGARRYRARAAEARAAVQRAAAMGAPNEAAQQAGYVCRRVNAYLSNTRIAESADREASNELAAAAHKSKIRSPGTAAGDPVVFRVSGVFKTAKTSLIARGTREERRVSVSSHSNDSPISSAVSRALKLGKAHQLLDVPVIHPGTPTWDVRVSRVTHRSAVPPAAAVTPRTAPSRLYPRCA